MGPKTKPKPGETPSPVAQGPVAQGPVAQGPVAAPPGQVEQLSAKGAVREGEFTKPVAESREGPPVPANVRSALEGEVEREGPGFLPAGQVGAQVIIPKITAETEGSGAYVYAGPVAVGGDVKAGDYSGVYAGVEAGPASIGVAQYAELSPSFEPTQMEPGMGEMGTQGGNLAIYKPTVAVEASVSENGSIYMGYTPATGEAEMILEHAPSWGPEAVSLGVVADAEGVAAADLRADLGRYNIRATYTPNENSVSLSVSKTF